MKSLFYFASVVRRIFILLIPQVEKEKQKGMMDINLRYVAAVTSLRGDHLLNIHTKVISSILRKNEHIGG